MEKILDTIIIGGGPAAVAAGVYAARKKMSSMLITESFGGQSIVAANIENWIGTLNISGYELAAQLEKHLRAQEGIEIRVGEIALKIKETEEIFSVKTDKGEYQSRTVIVCTGGRDRRLGIPGEDKFAGRGVAYCSTCDAPFYKGKNVAVIGGGNAGLEAVLDLVPYASSIKLLIREELPQGDPQTIEEINEIEKVRTIANADAKEILGDQKVSGIKYMNLVTGETRELDVEGVFVEVGVVPNSEIVKGLVELNGRKEIKIVSPCTGETSKKGIYAAGDVTEEVYKQNNIAAGDAIKATLSAYKYLMELKKNLRKKGNLED